MSRLNFSIALKMTTEQFKKGANTVKKGLRDIQYQVLGMASALGVGAIGLKGMVSQFIETARETNRARVALKNISGDAQGYGNNMNFLVRTSRKWGQELNVMTNEFSKFSAAASSAGVSIQDQYEIFESFTRSITAFGMGGQDATLSYLALSQMMSKGKVSSEELRRQLGEKMPIAMEAMARAAGVTIQELDGLLAQGKLLSKDIMLPFVREMEAMLPNVDVDNIETSVTRLRNTFIKLVDDMRIGEFYKKIVDGANKALSGVQKSFARIATVIITSLSGAKIGRAIMSLRTQTAQANTRMVAEKQRTELQKQVATEKRVAAEKRLNELNAIWEKNANEQTFQNQAKLQSMKVALTKARTREQAAYEAAERAASARTVTVWDTAWKNIKTQAIATFATIKALMVSVIPMAIIGAITNMVMRLREIRKEAKEIRNIFSEFEKEAKSISIGQEYKTLEQLMGVMQSIESTQEDINAARRELQGILQTEKTTEEEILNLTRQRMQAMRDMASAEFYTNKSIEAEAEIEAIQAKYGGERRMDERMRLRGTWSQVKSTVGAPFGYKSQIDLDYDRIEELKRVKRLSDENIQDLIKAGVVVGGAGDSTYTGGGGAGEKSDKTPLQKAEEKYATEIEKLTNQKEAGVIKADEYNKAMDDLNKATYEEIGGILGAASERNETFKKAKAGVEAPLAATSELAEITEDYNRSLTTLNRQKQLGLITDEHYNTAMTDLVRATIDKVLSLEEVSDAEREYIEGLRKISREMMQKPEMGERDTTFDYKKTKADIIAEELALQEQYAKDMESAYVRAGELTTEMLAEIAEEQAKVTSLSDALKLARLKEDIESINLDLFSRSISGVTGFADGLDRVARSWARLANEDMSGFERMVAIIKALGDTLKGLITTWEMYNDLKELISQREQARQALDNVNTAQSIANKAAEVAASGAVTAAKGPEVAAETAAAGAKAAGSVAGVPLVGPILAVSAVGAVLAALAALPKFAHGGIVGGTSTIGDRNLVRVNSGEMILTTAQQSGLWNAIRNNNFGGGGGRGSVEVKIRGRDLVGIIEQEGRVRSRR